MLNIIWNSSHFCILAEKDSTGSFEREIYFLPRFKEVEAFFVRRRRLGRNWLSLVGGAIWRWASTIWGCCCWGMSLLWKLFATEHNRCPKVNCSGAFCETTAAVALQTKEVEEWASTIWGCKMSPLWKLFTTEHNCCPRVNSSGAFCQIKAAVALVQKGGWYCCKYKLKKRANQNTTPNKS